jgi:hypothetical protein
LHGNLLVSGTSLHRTLRWRFLLAAVAFALIGSDFLAHFDLQVDLKRMRLDAFAAAANMECGQRRRCTLLPLALRHLLSLALLLLLPSCFTPSLPLAQPLPPAAVAALVPSNYKLILAEFPEVVNETKLLPTVSHKVEHYIETEGRPVSSKYRRLDPDRLAAAKAEFASLEEQGIVRRSSSNWVSPLHMVKKPDGSWRP